MADTNPLREKLEQVICEAMWGTGSWPFNGATGYIVRHNVAEVLDAVLPALAEFIGDGLLDANGQRVKLRRVGWCFIDDGIADGGIIGEDAVDPSGDTRWQPVFVLERSETDQEGQ